MLHVYVCTYIYIHRRPLWLQSSPHSSINEERPPFEILHCHRTQWKHENWPGPIPSAHWQVSSKIWNDDLQMAELPDSIRISHEYLYEIRDDSGIAIGESLRHLMENIFSDINGNFHAPEQQWILGWQKWQCQRQRTAKLIRLMPSFGKN